MKPKVYNKHTGDAPPDAVYIGRGSPYGNPFVLGKDGNRSECCKKYKEMVMNNLELLDLIKKNLKGKDLICFCAPKQCHGDILLEIANKEYILEEY